MNVTTDIETLAKDFLESQWPAVVLQMPGCADTLVNQSHKRRFGVNDFNVPPSLADCISYLSSTLKGQLKTTKEPKPSIACYCEKPSTKAVFALRGDLCAFESSFQTLLGDPHNCVSRLAFLNLRQVPNERKYEVFRVHSRLLTKDEKPGYMQSMLLPLGRSVSVSTAKSDPKDQTAQNLTVTLAGYLGEILWSTNYDVPEDEDYKWFSERLCHSIQRLKRGDSAMEVCHEMLDSVKQRTESEPKRVYEPLEGYIRARFSEENSRDLIDNLRSDQERLFDALVLTSEVQDTLEKEVLDLLPVQERQHLVEFQQTLQQVDPPIKADLFEVLIQKPTIQRRSAPLLTSAIAGGGTGIASSHTRGDNMETKSRQDDCNGHNPSLQEFKLRSAEFDRLLPDLLLKYPGQFVALFEGTVIEAGKDEMSLLKRVNQRHGNKVVLIRRVSDPSEEEVYIDTLGM